MEGNGCATAGFSMSCKSSPGNPWHEFGTNTKDWLANSGVPCNSSSGYYLTGNEFGEKIWAASGVNDSIFIGGPYKKEN